MARDKQQGPVHVFTSLSAQGGSALGRFGESYHLLPHRFAVHAVIARRVRSGQLRTVETCLDIHNRTLYPRVVALVRYKRQFKLKHSVKSFFVFVGVRVHPVTRVGYFETVLAKKPLIDFELTFVSDMPILIKFFDLAVLARRFVVYDDELAVRTPPYIAHTAADKQVGGFVAQLDTFLERVAPLVHSRVVERYGIQCVGLNERVRCFTRAMHVKFFFQECIYRAVEVERKSGRTGGTEFVIYIKTPLTLHVEAYLGTRQPEVAAPVVPIRISVGLVVTAHRGSIPH